MGKKAGTRWFSRMNSSYSVLLTVYPRPSARVSATSNKLSRWHLTCWQLPWRSLVHTPWWTCTHIHTRSRFKCLKLGFIMHTFNFFSRPEECNKEIVYAYSNRIDYVEKGKFFHVSNFANLHIFKWVFHWSNFKKIFQFSLLSVSSKNLLWKSMTARGVTFR